MKKTRFRDKYTILILSVVVGLSVIVLDTVVDDFIFPNGPLFTFEVYYRFLLVVVFVI